MLRTQLCVHHDTVVIVIRVIWSKCASKRTKMCVMENSVSIYLSIYLSIHPSIRPSIHPSIHPSITCIWMQVTFRLSMVQVIAYYSIDENPMLSWPYCSPRPDNMGIKNSEYDQEISQSQTADKSVASWGRATQHSQDTRKTSKAKQPALSSPSRLIAWQFRRHQTSPL